MLHHRTALGSHASRQASVGIATSRQVHIWAYDCYVAEFPATHMRDTKFLPIGRRLRLIIPMPNSPLDEEIRRRMCLHVFSLNALFTELDTRLRAIRSWANPFYTPAEDRAGGRRRVSIRRFRQVRVKARQLCYTHCHTVASNSRSYTHCVLVVCDQMQMCPLNLLSLLSSLSAVRFQNLFRALIFAVVRLCPV